MNTNLSYMYTFIHNVTNIYVHETFCWREKIKSDTLFMGIYESKTITQYLNLQSD